MSAIKVLKIFHSHNFFNRFLIPNSRQEKGFRRPGYREAVMTDGILVDDLIHEIDRLAESGTSDLGLVIYTCENAR